LKLVPGMRAASKVGDRPSKIGHARPLCSRIIRYVRDGCIDRQTDGQKQRFLPPSLRAGGGGIITFPSVTPRTLVLFQRHYCEQ